MNSSNTIEKKKRGRKPLSKSEPEINDDIIIPDNSMSSAKKRGRRSKTGKIVTTNNISQDKYEKKITQDIPNIILHLKCSLNDINRTNDKDVEYYNLNNNALDFNSITEENEKICFINKYSIIDTPKTENDIESDECDTNIVNTTTSKQNKEIWKKLKLLEQQLTLNNVNDKNSACFWCSYDFSNHVIHIPKYIINETYNCYGSFCSPECACAYLMKENIDNSTKFERYQLLNHLYGKIYNYSTNIKPAPDPHYLLDKFYGNLNIQEYRSLLKNNRLFIVVDKPLTLVMSELIEDNDNFILNKKIIPTNNSNKNKIKVGIVSENFGFE